MSTCTSAAPNDNDHVLLLDGAYDDRVVHEMVDLDQRAMQFLDETKSLDTDADSSGEDVEAEDRGGLVTTESIIQSNNVLYNHILNKREMSKKKKTCSS